MQHYALIFRNRLRKIIHTQNTFIEWVFSIHLLKSPLLPWTAKWIDYCFPCILDQLDLFSFNNILYWMVITQQLWFFSFFWFCFRHKAIYFTCKQLAQNRFFIAIPRLTQISPNSDLVYLGTRVWVILLYWKGKWVNFLNLIPDSYESHQLWWIKLWNLFMSKEGLEECKIKMP